MEFRTGFQNSIQVVCQIGFRMGCRMVIEVLWFIIVYRRWRRYHAGHVTLSCENAMKDLILPISTVLQVTYCCYF